MQSRLISSVGGKYCEIVPGSLSLRRNRFPLLKVKYLRLEGVFRHTRCIAVSYTGYKTATSVQNPMLKVNYSLYARIRALSELVIVVGALIISWCEAAHPQCGTGISYMGVKAGGFPGGERGEERLSLSWQRWPWAPEQTVCVVGRGRLGFPPAVDLLACSRHGHTDMEWLR